jgi:hypothetical protein
MKKTIACVMLVSVLSTASAVDDKLARAISSVESGHNDRAVGDEGRALGRYQAHASAVKDYNKANRASLRHSDMRDPRKARLVLDWYLGHYGKGRSAVDKARIWNGGPEGHTKGATLAYGRRVLSCLAH